MPKNDKLTTKNVWYEALDAGDRQIILDRETVQCIMETTC